MKELTSRLVFAFCFTFMTGSPIIGQVRQNLFSTTSLALEGGKLSVAQAEELRKHIESSPLDVEARTKLLGYYFITGRKNEGAESIRVEQVLWLVSNAPESEILGRPFAHIDHILNQEGHNRVKSAWISALEDQPDNLKMLAHASWFFSLSEDRQMVPELLSRGQKLEPNQAEWPERLGHYYESEMRWLDEPAERAAKAAEALEQYKAAYKLSGPMRKLFLLSELATSAYAAGQFEFATSCAEKLIENKEDDLIGNENFHLGNLVLGRIALSRGDVNEAKRYLLQSVNISESQSAGTFGPYMFLAKELLEIQEREVVLEYLALCKNIWESGEEKLDSWTEQINSGKTPDFGRWLGD